MGLDNRLEPRALAEAFASELAAVMGALLGTPAVSQRSTTGIEPGWALAATLDGGPAADLALGITRDDAARLAQLVMGVDGPPADEAVVDMLQEVCGQAFGALSQKPMAGGGRVVGGPARPAGLVQIEGEVAHFRIALTPDFSPIVAVWTRVRQPEVAAGPATAAAPASRTPTPEAAQGLPANLDVILDIDLPLSVCFGETEMTLETLTRLGPGSVIDLGRSPDDPVDVLVNGRLVARGEVVVVAGNYGVRVVEVVSAADRVRSLRG